MDKIEGFQLYLTVTENKRLSMVNPLEQTPDLFDRYLPYALALDVEQRWAKQFEYVMGRFQINTGAGYAPSWYDGSHWQGFGAAELARELSSTFSQSLQDSVQRV